MIEFEAFGQREVQQLLRGMEDQIPFATALTLTRTAQDVQGSVRGHMRGVFSAPTPYTLRGVRVKPATKRDLEARIWLVDEATKGTPPARYLEAQIRGGTRRHKRHERALQRAGILPAGMYTVPGKDARTNKYGNLTGGTYTRILSQLQASPDDLQNAPRGRRRQYFVLRKRGRPVGVYQRTGKRTIKSILHFVDRVSYSPRLRFAEVADKVIERRLPEHMREAILQTLRTSQRRSPRTTRQLLPLDPRSFLG